MGSKNIVSPVQKAVLDRHLQGYPVAQLYRLRADIRRGCSGVREKFNKKCLYLGFAKGRSDALYVYVQQQGLVIDVRVPAGQARKLVPRMFTIRPRLNYQGRAGWLTGIRIPHSGVDLAPIVKLAVYALAEHRL